MLEATTVTVENTRPTGKKIKKSLKYINPAASDRNVAKFVDSLQSLSLNTVGEVKKLQTSTIDFNNLEG